MVLATGKSCDKSSVGSAGGARRGHLMMKRADCTTAAEI